MKKHRYRSEDDSELKVIREDLEDGRVRIKLRQGTEKVIQVFGSEPTLKDVEDMKYRFEVMCKNKVTHE